MGGSMAHVLLLRHGVVPEKRAVGAVGSGVPQRGASKPATAGFVFKTLLDGNGGGKNLTI